MSTRGQICGTLGIFIGIWAFRTTQNVTKDMFEPIMTACTTSPPDTFGITNNYHPYEPLLGGTFVCLITQFLYELRHTAGVAGLFTWGATVATACPTIILMNVESGRGDGSTNITRYPTLIGVLGQILGISVVFPALWVPGYCGFLFFGKGAGADNSGAVSPKRVFLSVVPLVVSVASTVLLFTLDVDSRAWTIAAGVLGGPLVAMLPLMFWGIKAPKTTPQSVMEGSRALCKMYAFSGLLAYIGWMIILRSLIFSYGTDLNVIWSVLWSEANPAVAFMTIDAVVLFLGMLLYIFSISIKGAIMALITFPFLGPGAACAFVMSSLELQRGQVQANELKDEKNK